MAALSTIVESGQKMLAAGASALDAVTEAVRLLEECPLFNAGMGAVFTRDQTHELDACVMDGYSLQAGAVAGVKHLRNPVLAARLVLEKSPHVLLIGEGRKILPSPTGWRACITISFPLLKGCCSCRRRKRAGDYPRPPRRSPRRTPENGHRRRGGARSGRQSGGGDLHRRHDQQTARTRRRQPAAGRGCYANNASVAVSCTGTGEVFMRTLAAYDIAALMEYGQLSLYSACERVVMEKLPALGGSGGLIAVDREGNVVLPFNSEGMYRAWCYAGDTPTIGIYRE